MSNVRDFGAIGDGQADDSRAIAHAVDRSDGRLSFPRGQYLITRPIEIDLSRTGRLAVEGSGGTARLVMAGSGPAIRIRGTHSGTAHPPDVKPEIWTDQRMPTIRGLEIEGDHPDADGVELVGTMQPTLTDLLVRRVRNGVILRSRNRNVILQSLHIYHNHGVGVLVENCNLHQFNITGCHISYNRLGGIRITGSEVRNLQITGNDIEYNNHKTHGTDPQPTAEIYIDATAEGASVREVTIASNTIQATWSAGGANVRVIASADPPHRSAGMLTIAGNLIGNQDTNVHLTGCRGVALSGNFIYSGARRNLLLEDCRELSIGANSFGHNPDTRGLYWATGIRLENCADCTLHGLQITDSPTGTHTAEGLPPIQRQGLLELYHCRRISVTGCTIGEGAPVGVDVLEGEQVSISGCQITDRRPTQRMESPIRWRGPGRGNRLMHNTLTGSPTVADESGVTMDGNIPDA